jgi:hypothetical protein
MAGDGISVVSLSDSDVIFTLPVLLLPSGIRPRQLVIRANATATNFAVRTFPWMGVFGATEGEISMQRKILALAAAAALGAAMTTGAMAAHVGGGGGAGGRGMSMGGGGHAMTMGGGHAMTMGGARMNTFALAPHANFVRPGVNRFVSTWGHPATGAWANRTWAGGNWGHHHHHHRHFFVGGALGVYAFGGNSYDCYNWPYYSYPYNGCYGNSYAW